MCKTLVAYYRVSTKKQAKYGYSLSIQENEIQSYSREHNKPIIAAYTEIASGRKNERPELTKALIKIARTNSTLIVSYIDRLTRDSIFAEALIDSGIKSKSYNSEIHQS